MLPGFLTTLPFLELFKAVAPFLCLTFDPLVPETRMHAKVTQAIHRINSLSQWLVGNDSIGDLPLITGHRGDELRASSRQDLELRRTILPQTQKLLDSQDSTAEVVGTVGEVPAALWERDTSFREGILVLLFRSLATTDLCQASTVVVKEDCVDKLRADMVL